MKKYLFLLFILILGACKPISTEYLYDINPKYTWGAQVFYGDYYSQYDVIHNVSSLLLFTENLSADDDGMLNGYGHYLNIPDIFTNISYDVLPDGKYIASEHSIPFSFRPGKYIGAVGQRYITGAWVYFIEPNDGKSVRKLITGGSFTVTWLRDEFSMTCDFTTDDGKTLKGHIDGYRLPFVDDSSKKADSPSGTNRRMYYHMEDI